MKKCSLAKMNEVFAAVAAKENLYLPVDNNVGKAEYKKWSEGTVWSEKLNTVRSAKDFFFPQTEDLVKFRTEGKKIDIIDVREETEDFVIFGVRACDVRSFTVLDNVFMKAEPVDTYYTNRRKHSTIVSLACGAPSETCFCATFGIDATEPEGDVVMWKVNGEVYFKANTEKGEAFLATIDAFLTDADEKVVEGAKAEAKKVLSKLPLAGLTPDKFGGDKTMDFFKDPAWATLSESCLGCGTCTFVCPTCQCYDIKDFNTGKEVIRFRCWDSCMYSEFTRMSAGQPRATQLERFRQRFMHKLVYYPANNEGLFGCVGCGRCLSRCPINMNIVKVMKKLGGEKQ